MRTCPVFMEEENLNSIDEIVMSTLSDITNIDFSDNAKAWEQATLPVRFGGLGVRSVASLALPAFISSMLASKDLVAQIFPGSKMSFPSNTLQSALDLFGDRIGENELPHLTDSILQREWDDKLNSVQRDRLLADSNQVHRARLIAATQPHSGAWLQALPSPNLGNHLDRETIRIGVALRLGCSICEPHACRQCRRPVDHLGHHGLSCRHSAGRFSRHANLNDVVKRSLACAGLPSVLEPVGLDRGDGRRPDGLTIFPYKLGKCLSWDATCVDTFAESHILNSALEPGRAAETAEDHKVRKYQALSTAYLFQPVAIETTGVMGRSTSKFISELGRLLSSTTGDPREACWLRQRLSLAVMRGNAAAILATAPRLNGS